jgi:hypothetical protein
VPCTGYRDTQNLRVRNESQAVRRKAGKDVSKTTQTLTPRPQHLPLSLQSRARDAFFASHVDGTSRSWDFLSQFHDPTNVPQLLALSIDAVSLAYLSQQVYSDAALAVARERYISALYMTSKALQHPEEAAQDTTLLASLLLDLFEKITSKETQRDESWLGHVNGALALVKLRGLEQFQDTSAIRILVRFSTHFLISCVASETQVPQELNELRAHAGKYMNTSDPKWRLSDFMVLYANLHNDIRQGFLYFEERLSRSLGLDAKLHALALDMPPSWQYKSCITYVESDMIFNHRVDYYNERHITQTCNVLRLIRILLNQYILEQCLEATSTSTEISTDSTITIGTCPLLIQTSKDNIETLATEVFASVPQYTDCSFAAGRTPHAHSPSDNLNCYTLIFPLYCAARSRVSSEQRGWATKQLHYMGSHFGIRNAELVAGILDEGTDITPWAVYAMLGSYAFAA